MATKRWSRSIHRGAGFLLALAAAGGCGDQSGGGPREVADGGPARTPAVETLEPPAPGPVEGGGTATEDEAEDDGSGREAFTPIGEARPRVGSGGLGAFMAIREGVPATGIFVNRRGAGKRRSLESFGGSRAGQDAVEAALGWFQRHQSPNGQWDPDGYPVNCSLPGPRCEPGRDRMGADPAVTAYALLCYLGAGYDHRLESRYRRTVERGLAWLTTAQGEDGSWGRNYENAVCTTALAEAYALTRDAALRGPAQRGVDLLLARQTPAAEGGGSGWGYTGPQPARHDSSVSGWCVQALRSAAAAGLDTRDGLVRAEWWLVRAWRATNPQWRTLDPQRDGSRFPYTWNQLNGRTNSDHLSCVGACCAAVLDHGAGDPMFETLTNDVLSRHLEASRSWPVDTYYLYYNTLALFRQGGAKWRRWNRVFRDMLVDAQRREPACFRGSWDPAGAGGHRVAEVGRTLVSAYACLSLEVYYRYAPPPDTAEAP